MNRLARLTLLCTLAVGSVGGAVLTPTEAQACGGTFCDAGTPTPMPVDQTGENILFVRDGDMVEAHIQIQYDGDPEKFGWVIPLTAEPTEIAPGSEPLFANILAASVPTYGFSTQNDSCQAPDAGNNGQGLTGGDPGGTGAAGDDGGGDEGGPEVDVLSQQNVGAFEVTILAAEEASEVGVWLEENDYQNDEAALPILQQYLDEDHVFAAVKLTSGAGVEEIHPIMLRFKSDEACVPLRLTRIAAVDDMQIRTFFLGDSRTVPRNYRHVEVNPLKIDWPNQATNYNEVVTLAVDETSADGRAFVTEYAGPSNVVNQAGIVNPAWNSAAFEDVAATGVIDLLTQQGLWECGEDFDTFEFVCRPTHQLLQPMLDEFLPVPDSIEATEFYQNLSKFEGLIDAEAWDAVEFAAQLQDVVIGPGQHAEDLLNQFSYLTRMYTTISPAEMTEDPFFHENSTLPEVMQLRSATQRRLCNSDSIWTLPDGREVYVPSGASWPDFDVEAPMDAPMASAEFIEEVGPTGAPMRLVDNQEAIDIQLRAYNDGFGWDGTTVPEGSDPGADSDSGCGCRTGGGKTGWLLGLGFVVLGITRRRR